MSCWGTNPFLHAQSGVFIFDATGEGVTPSLADLILGYDLQVEAIHIDWTDTRDVVVGLAKSVRLLRLTLPMSERGALLEQLTARRVTKAHLQPSLDNVVRQLWGRSSLR